jgi:hypothetical protein
MSMSHRAVAWNKDDPPGAELAIVEFAGDLMRAHGVAIGSEPEPYRLDYELETHEGFVTSRVRVRASGRTWFRELELRRRAGRGWTADVSQEGGLPLPDAGGDVADFAAALDADLGLSPLFNTMPVLRHGIHHGSSADDFLMVWISVPDLSLHASAQRYTHVESRGADEHVVRFEAVGEGDDFEANVVFDAHGLVVDYPGIARRIGSR